jgi:hypothetical protein
MSGVALAVAGLRPFSYCGAGLWPALPHAGEDACTTNGAGLLQYRQFIVHNEAQVVA